MNKTKVFKSIVKQIEDSEEIIFNEIFDANTSKIIITISDPDNKNTYKIINNLIKKN
ncbi:MAG: hypothetical protein K0R72_708 [Clostridia bacterium]|jgi:hypothetical protein|nr:hypothetical protein [Clostridia bacterium]